MATMLSTSRSHARDQKLFAGLLALSFLVWWNSMSSTLALSVESEAHTHILLIAPVSIALIWLTRNTVRQSVERGISSAAILLGTGLLLAVVTRRERAVPNDLRLTLSMLGLVGWWFGSVILCFGMKAFRSFSFPLCLLLWLVPIPQFALNLIIEWLQAQSATVARWLFELARVPVTQDGFILSIPGLDIEVASHCSSIRSSLILLITTLILVHLLLNSLWRKVLVVAAAIPLAALKNGLRIFVIAELGTRVDPEFLNGRLHHQGGFLFFALSLAMTGLLIWILRRTGDFRRHTGVAAAN